MEQFAGNVINVVTSLHAKQNSMFSTTRSSKKSMITTRYKDDENFVHKVCMLAALAFVPLPDVIDAFESVADEFPLMLKK